MGPGAVGLQHRPATQRLRPGGGVTRLSSRRATAPRIRRPWRWAGCPNPRWPSPRRARQRALQWAGPPDAPPTAFPRGFENRWRTFGGAGVSMVGRSVGGQWLELWLSRPVRKELEFYPEGVGSIKSAPRASLPPRPTPQCTFLCLQLPPLKKFILDH